MMMMLLVMPRLSAWAYATCGRLPIQVASALTAAVCLKKTWQVPPDATRAHVHKTSGEIYSMQAYTRYILAVLLSRRAACCQSESSCGLCARIGVAVQK